MNNVKDKMGVITLGGQDYKVAFNLNVLSDMQDRYGDIGVWGDKISDIKELRWTVAALINGNSDEDVVTERFVGKCLDIGAAQRVVEQLTELMTLAMPDANEETSPNSQAG